MIVLIMNLAFWAFAMFNAYKIGTYHGARKVALDTYEAFMESRDECAAALNAWAQPGSTQRGGRRAWTSRGTSSARAKRSLRLKGCLA